MAGGGLWRALQGQAGVVQRLFVAQEWPEVGAQKRRYRSAGNLPLDLIDRGRCAGVVAHRRPRARVTVQRRQVVGFHLQARPVALRRAEPVAAQFAEKGFVVEPEAFIQVAGA